LKAANDARPFLPTNPRAEIDQLRRAADKCRGCDLYKDATQVVFGEGKTSAKIMFIGEQPGDKEDIEGKPFVGPAGQLLRRAMSDAHIEHSEVYVTNAVKHFKWVVSPRGKKRLHSKP
jgi:DNA polymerase